MLESWTALSTSSRSNPGQQILPAEGSNLEPVTSPSDDRHCHDRGLCTRIPCTRSLKYTVSQPCNSDLAHASRS